MAEDMTFLPRKQVLSLEELSLVARAFVNLGVEKIRITGGEPLIRKDVIRLFDNLGQLGLKDLSITTNGSRLAEFAKPLVKAGVHRVNISLDSLQAEKFKALTRHGDLNKVLEGIQSAKRAGFERIKLNAVLMRHFNFDEALHLVQFCLDNGLDISFIEEMPLGNISSHERNIEFVASEQIRQTIGERYSLEPIQKVQDQEATGGPSRYWQVPGFDSRIGFISPHSENFCSTCNRVRVSAEGRLLLCLGNEHSVDLKTILRTTNPTKVVDELEQAITQSMDIKPEKHHFDLDQAPQILRFMNATGG